MDDTSRERERAWCGKLGSFLVVMPMMLRTMRWGGGVVPDPKAMVNGVLKQQDICMAGR